MAFFALLGSFSVVSFASPISLDDATLIPSINALADMSSVDDDVLSVIRTALESVYPEASILNSEPDDAEYQMDEHMDCVVDIHEGTDELNAVVPIIAQKLELNFSEEAQMVLSEAVTSAVNILCRPPQPDPTLDEVDGFKEWVIMRNKKRRSIIEKIIKSEMKDAFKLKLSKNEKSEAEESRFGHILTTKCLNQLNPSKTRKMYGELRSKYPSQRHMMQMIPGIFMMHCSRHYATNAMIQDFMRILMGSEGKDQFFNFMEEIVEPVFKESADSKECIEKSSVLVDELERFLLSEHIEFRKYPVQNAMATFIEMGCVKRFASEGDEVADEKSVHSEL